jgi:uncharacterized protein (TIGR01777 family)
MVENLKSVLIIGGSGFIAERIGEYLVAGGFVVRVLSRNPEATEGTLAFPAEVFGWDGESISDAAISGCYGVINLAGESIADGRWNHQKKAMIETSRIKATAALAAALKATSNLPQVVIQGSAIGIYGNNSLERKDETAEAASDFLAGVCRKWERVSANFPANIRLVIMRTGMVLGWSGGALPELAGIYARGFGAVLGSGKQWMNWIHIDDIAAFVLEALNNPDFSGPFNLVAPENCTNRSFHERLCKYYPITSPLPVPAFVLKAVLGEKSTIVLNGPEVVADKLLGYGFAFAFPKLDGALNELYGFREYPGEFALQVKQYIPKQIAEIWPFFSSETNLEKLTPTWLGFHVVGKNSAEIEEGTKISYKLNVHGIPLAWESQIIEWKSEQEFVDRQCKGPFKIWHHRHLFKKLAHGVQITDFIQFRLPFFPFSLPASEFILKDLKKIFSYRKIAVRKALWKKSTVPGIGVGP